MVEVLLSHLSERSVLHDPGAPRFEPFVARGRKRLATCSGVFWFRGHHLAVVNLYGCHLRVYRFHAGSGAAGDAARVELLHELSEGMPYPEDVAVSPDGKWVAVTHSLSDAGVSLHPIDESALAPGPGGETIRPGWAFHGVRFSPDSRHLALTEIGGSGYVEVLRVDSGSWERTCFLENRQRPLKPKSVAFSDDARFPAITSAPNATRDGVDAGEAPAGIVSVHRFDAATGVIAADAVAELRGGAWPWSSEMCTFLPGSRGDRYRIVVTDHVADVATEIDLDPAERTLTFTRVFVDGLSFPHGLDASSDGRFVAITNYGDDTLRVCRISR